MGLEFANLALFKTGKKVLYASTSSEKREDENINGAGGSAVTWPHL